MRSDVSVHTVPVVPSRVFSRACIMYDSLRSQRVMHASCTYTRTYVPTLRSVGQLETRRPGGEGVVSSSGALKARHNPSPLHLVNSPIRMNQKEGGGISPSSRLTPEGSGRTYKFLPVQLRSLSPGLMACFFKELHWNFTGIERGIDNMRLKELRQLGDEALSTKLALRTAIEALYEQGLTVPAIASMTCGCEIYVKQVIEEDCNCLPETYVERTGRYARCIADATAQKLNLYTADKQIVKRLRDEGLDHKSAARALEWYMSTTKQFYDELAQEEREQAAGDSANGGANPW